MKLCTAPRAVVSVLLVMATLLFVGCDRAADAGGAPADVPETKSGPPSTTANSLTPPGGSQLDHAAITDFNEILNHANPAELTDRAVRLNGVIQKDLGKLFRLVGPSADRVIPLRLREFQPDLREGARVRVSGVIAQFGEDLSQWAPEVTDPQIVHQHRIFINAFEVAPETGGAGR